jgi:PhzF family phenazine biosynthesis protein
MRFSQVDVFSSEPLRGNPVAVVHHADGLTEDQMRAFARWTNLSETTFLLTPTEAAADYRVRIFTPGEELPFAGHPTLGSAHAWLEAGGAPAGDGVVVQECGAGLVDVRRGETLAFAAPPLRRSGRVDASDVAAIARAIGVEEAAILDSAWIDNGPGWVGVRLGSADEVLALEPDWASFGDLKIGVVGPHRSGDAAIEVRAFCPQYGVPEDPVTGSLNAGIGQWLTATGDLPTSYVAAQGTVLGRAGRVQVTREGDTLWVGGHTTTTVAGDVRLGG